MSNLIFTSTVHIIPVSRTASRPFTGRHRLRTLIHPLTSITLATQLLLSECYDCTKLIVSLSLRSMDNVALRGEITIMTTPFGLSVYP